MANAGLSLLPGCDPGLERSLGSRIAALEAS